MRVVSVRSTGSFLSSSSLYFGADEPTEATSLSLSFVATIDLNVNDKVRLTLPRSFVISSVNNVFDTNQTSGANTYFDSPAYWSDSDDQVEAFLTSDVPCRR